MSTKINKQIQNTINNRARDKYLKEVGTFEDLIPEKWYECWFTEAETVKQEFLNEGLNNSAASVDDIIKFNKDIVNGHSVST